MIHLFLVLIPILLCLAFFYWYKYHCIDQIDKIIMNPVKQLLVLSLCVILVFGLLIIIGVLASGDTKNIDIIVFIYGLFSQTASAYNPSHDINFQIYSVFVSIVGAVFFSGILVSTITNSIICRVDEYKKGKIHYKHLKGHNIIIGANEILSALVNSFKQEKGKIIIVSEKSPKEIRKILYNVESSVISDKIIIYNDHPLDPDVLKWLSLEKCSSLTILGEKNIYSNDADNIIFLDSLMKYTNQPTFKSSSPVKCYISYYDSYHILNYCRNEKSVKVRIIPFNFYATCINRVWGIGQLHNKITQISPSKTDKPYNYISLFGGNYSSVVILGYSVCAEEVIKFIMLNAHCVNKKIEIVLVTTNTSDVDRFKYKTQIDNIGDVAFTHKVCSEYSKECFQLIDSYAQLGGLYIVCCDSDANKNLSVATNLPKSVYRYNVPILIKADYYMPCNSPLDNNGNPLSHVMFFGHNDQVICKTVDYELSTAQCFRYIHKNFTLQSNFKGKELANIASDYWFGKDGGSKQIDLPKINIMSRIAFINTIFDLADIEICRKEDGAEFKNVLPIETFLQAFHYQQCAFYTLHGYTANDVTNYVTKEISQITSYTAIKSNKNVIEAYTRFYNDIELWLYINNLGCRKRVNQQL